MSTLSPAQLPPRWQREPPEVRARSLLSSRGWLLFLALALAGALAGVFAGLLGWRTGVPRPRLIPIYVTAYGSTLIPDNYAAQNDHEALQRGHYFPDTGGLELVGEDRGLMQAELAALPNRPADEDVVLYLTAYAGVNEQSQVFLIPATFDPRGDRTGLLLRSLLDLFRRCPARQKLLVLDICWPMVNPQVGVLTDDVAAHIDAELAAVEDPDRLVLVPCSPGQVSLVSEDLQRSLFGYHFEQALRGQADGYNPQTHRDGRVSVRELAAFVRARVDRWAWIGHHQRQTPRLLGDRDFDLIALPFGEPRPADDLPPLRSYPDWLTAGWKLRDQWRAQGWDHLMPLAYYQLGAVLLNAEDSWRLGGDAPETLLRTQTAQLEDLLAQGQRLVPSPPPRSLALARSQGQQVDPALSQKLAELLQKIQVDTRTLKPADAQAASAKLIQDFLTSVKDKASVELAWAVWDQALQDAVPTRERLQQLDGLLLEREPQPRYVETRLLHRLAELARGSTADSWPATLVGLVLGATQRGETAASQPQGVTRLRSLLVDASLARHQGETLFWASGYAPADRAREQLERAEQGFATILGLQAAIRDARQVLDDGVATLISYRNYLDRQSGPEEQWEQAVALTRTLAEMLILHPEPAGQDVQKIEQAVQQIHQVAGRLEGILALLLQPFSDTSVSQVTSAASSPDANAVSLGQAQTLLSCPYLSAAQRVPLCQARIRLARRLSEQAHQLDERDNRLKAVTAAPEPASGQLAMLEQLRLAWQRARHSVALLRLAGLPAGQLRPFTEELERARAQDYGLSPHQMAFLLMAAWMDDVPALPEKAATLAEQSWVLRALPTSDPTPVLFQGPRLIAPRVQAETVGKMLTALAEDYRYRARDGMDEAFYLAAASGYSTRAGLSPELYVVFLPDGQPPALGASAATATYTLSWTLAGTPPPSPSLATEVFSPAPDLLQIRPLTRQLSDLLYTEPLRITWNPDLGGTEPPPRGFLAQVSVDGRPFHYRVPLPSLAGAPPVELLLGPAPDRLAPWPAELRLRPVQGAQSYFVGVRSRTATALNLQVELTPGGPAPLKVALAPGATQVLSWQGAAPKPGADLPELSGPLALRVLDADGGKLLIDQALRVGVAQPYEYVQVADARFQPGDLVQNRLDVQLLARDPLAPPPCQAELVLSPDGIPGLLKVQGGGLRGTLPPDGATPLALFAQNLALAPGVPEQGAAYLTVDGCERAFVLRGTFARTGNAPIQLHPQLRPSLRLQAAPAARPGPGYLVRVLADSAPEDATLQVRLGRGVGDQVRPVLQALQAAPRQRRVGFQAGGPDGALLFQGSLRDWSIPFDTTGLVGSWTLAARLLSASGQTIASASQPVVIDDSAPQGVTLLDVKAAAPGAIAVRATALDSLSGIEKAIFWIGKPLDGKIPPNTATVDGQESADAPGVWAATLGLDPTVKGPFDVTVRFVNNAGLSADVTRTIDPGQLAPPTTGTIQGTVLEGPRPQPNLQVTLRPVTPAATTPPATPAAADKPPTATTDADGAFIFRDVKPGRYTLETSKPSSGRKGKAEVAVQAGQTATVSIALSI